MRHRISGILAGVAGLASAAFFALSGASCSQPAIQCVAGHGPFIAKYTLVSGTGSCAELKGEEIGLSTFLAPNADRSLADYSKRTIAIQSSTLGGLIQERSGLPTAADPNTPAVDKSDKPYGIGTYTTDPDDNNICYAGGFDVGAMAEADLDIPDTDSGDVDDMGNPVILPATHLKQSWKNVKVYVTAAVPGTQAVGEMHFENVTEGCTADYKFTALFPAVYCEGSDADGNGTGMPDDKLCDPVANPDEGRVYGSGINPDFKTHCDPDLLYCVLTETPLPGNP